jgi:hypothetical protein
VSIPADDQLRVSSKDGMTMVPVPAGEFTIGAKPKDVLAACQEFSTDCQLDWLKNEEPPHQVYLDAYWIDQWELAMIMLSMFHGKVSWMGNLTLHESDEQSHLHQQS